MLENPYEAIDLNNSFWLKANFHTHAGTVNDRFGVEEVIAEYKDANYDVLTISNQDVLTDTAKYTDTYGILMISGFEYTRQEDMLCIGIDTLPEGGHQEVIDECGRQGGLTVLCHPNWQRKGYFSKEKMLALRGYAGVEIYNAVIFRLSGTGLATDAWDTVLSRGKLIWGFANDDFHRWYDMNRAWNVVNADSLSPAGVIRSLQNGRFYCSTGLWMEKAAYDGKSIVIYMDSRNNYVREYNFKFFGRAGELLYSHHGTEGVYHCSGNESYVRVQVEGEHGAMLWTQPFFDPDRLKRDFR